MDIKNWKEFRVGDLFDVETSPGFDMVNINILNKMNDDYKYEFIIRSKENNGVKGYVEYLGTEPNEKNKITISQVGTIVAQYRTNDYYTSQNVFNLSPKFDLTKNKALFFVSSLNCVLKKYSGYSDYPTLKSLKNEIIELPTKDDKPDFDYMEDFIKNRENVVKEKIENFKNIKERKSKIDTQEWGEFRVGDLFDVINSKPYHKKDVIELNDKYAEGINYVTRSKFNNGILCKVFMDDKFIINPKDTISFGAENADFFLQEESYITGNKMYYINTSKLTNNQILFFKTLLQVTLTQKYGYTDGLTGAKLKEEKIFLPTKNNEPDWEYMEDYINKKQKEVREKLELLRR